MTILALPERIRRAEAKLPPDAAAFLDGITSYEDFRAQRVPQGLYEQRTPGAYMLRLRLPGGMLSLDQAAKLAVLTEVHGCQRLHLTTREAIQCHDLPLPAAVAIQQGLAAIGLSARGTGGNTVRNVTADHLSGVAQDEVFDVRPWNLATTQVLLEREDCDSLPRKFKVAFSGSPADRAGAGVADVGFIATMKDGAQGFQVFVGGGLGGKPVPALEIFPWVPVAEAPRITTAILSLFIAHGDKNNKAIARLRHVRHRLGNGPFLSLCREWIDRQAALPGLSPITAPGVNSAPGGSLPARLLGKSGLVAQRQMGRFAVRLAPPLGDLLPRDLAAIVRAARTRADGVLRVGLDQEIWLTGVAGDQVENLLADLDGLTLGQPGTAGVRIPACAGADTCKLGLLRSRPAALAISERLTAEGLDLKGIRISGCPNSCGRHLVGGIGLQGRAKKVRDRLMPCYDVMQNGHHGAESAIATRLGTVPARQITELMVAVARGGDLATEVARFEVLPQDIPEEWYHDWADEARFSLTGLGQGECAAG